MEKFTKAIFDMVVMVVLALLTAWVVLACWNYAVPAIFHLTEITYWQAFALTVLCHQIMPTKSCTHGDKDKDKD